MDFWKLDPDLIRALALIGAAFVCAGFLLSIAAAAARADRRNDRAFKQREDDHANHKH